MRTGRGWCIPRRALRADAALDATDLDVVIRNEEESNRHSVDAAANLFRRIDDPMNSRDPLVVRPPHQEVADIDDKSVLNDWDIGPVAAAAQHLEAAGRVLAFQDREGAIVRVRAGAQLFLLRWALLDRIIIDTHITDVALAAPDEEFLVEVERKREDARQMHGQGIPCAPIRADRRTEFGHAVRPKIRMGMNRAISLGPIRIIVGFQRPEAQALHQIRRRALAHGQAEALPCDGVIAAADSGAGPLDAHLLFERTREERTAAGKCRPQDRVRHLVSRNDEESDTLTGLLHRVDYTPAGAGIAGCERRNIDCRNRRIRVGNAFAVRREAVVHLLQHDHLLCVAGSWRHVPLLVSSMNLAY